MSLSTVATIAGYKSHYTQDGRRTLCGREVSNGTSGIDMCKACEKSAAKITDYADRTAYAARAAETQDDVMHAAPVERNIPQEMTERAGITVPDAPMCAAHKRSGWQSDNTACIVLPNGVHTYMSLIRYSDNGQHGIAVIFPYSWEARRDVTGMVTFYADGGELTMDMLARAYAGETIDGTPVELISTDTRSAYDRVVNPDGVEGPMTGQHDTYDYAADRFPCRQCGERITDAEASDAPHAGQCGFCGSDGHSGCQHAHDAYVIPAPFESYEAHTRWSVGPVATREEHAARITKISEDAAAGTLPTNVAEWGWSAAELAEVKANAEILAALTTAEKHMEPSAPTCMHGNGPDCAECEALDAQEQSEGSPALTLTRTNTGRVLASIGSETREFLDNPAIKLHAAMWAHTVGWQPVKGRAFKWARNGKTMSAPAKTV